MDDDDATVNRAIFGEMDLAPGKRQTISKEDLMAHLTKMIQTCEGCEGVRVVGVTRLDFPDKDGRNWARSLVLDAPGVAAEVYALAYASVIGTAHDTWNLK